MKRAWWRLIALFRLLRRIQGSRKAIASVSTALRTCCSPKRLFLCRRMSLQCSCCSSVAVAASSGMACLTGRVGSLSSATVREVRGSEPSLVCCLQEGFDRRLQRAHEHCCRTESMARHAEAPCASPSRLAMLAAEQNAG